MFQGDEGSFRDGSETLGAAHLDQFVGEVQGMVPDMHQAAATRVRHQAAAAAVDANVGDGALRVTRVGVDKK